MTSKLKASPKRKSAERRGRRSETIAALFLMCKFYRILGRRMRSRLGEIDLIALSPAGAICFIEVKARQNGGLAAEAVLPRQRARIVRAAQQYIALRPRLAEAPIRFDIVTVAPRALPRHIRGAWRPDDTVL